MADALIGIMLVSFGQGTAPLFSLDKVRESHNNERITLFHTKETAVTATALWPPSGPAWRDAVAHERALIQQGRYREALRLCETMYDAAERASAPPGVLAMLWAHRGDLLRYVEDFQGAADAYAECLRRLKSITEQANCPQVLIIPLHTCAAIQLRRSRVDDALALLDRSDDALERADPTLNRRFIQLHTMLLRAWSAAAAGDVATARRLYLQARQIADLLRLPSAHRLMQVITDGLDWLDNPTATPPDPFLWDEPAHVGPAPALFACCV